MSCCENNVYFDFEAPTKQLSCCNSTGRNITFLKMAWKYINRQCKWTHICIDCLDVGDFPYYLHSYYLFNVFETYTNVSNLYFATIRIISFTAPSCIDSGPRRFNLLPACLCRFLPVALPLSLSLPPSKPPLPTHSVSHTYCLPARSLLLSDKLWGMDCSSESTVGPSWSHPRLCPMHIQGISLNGLVADFSGKRLVHLNYIRIYSSGLYWTH